MSKEPVIYFDCDGVLVDYIEGFFQYCREQGDPIPDSPKDIHTDYDLFKLGFWDDIQVMFNRMHDYCYTMYWSNPRALVAPDSLKLMKELGIEVHCITLVSDRDRWGTRRDMLSRYFKGVFDSVSFTNFKESKIDYILERTDGNEQDAWLIEDKLDTIIEAYQSPIIPILIDQTYNRLGCPEGVTRADNCQEAINMILNHYKSDKPLRFTDG